MSALRRPVRADDRVSAHLGHRPLQLPLRYCMPLEGLPWLPKADILSYEEIREVVAQLAPLGLRRVRHHRRRADDPSAARDARADAARRAGGRGHRAVDERREASRAGARSSRDAGLDRVNMSADSLQAGAHRRDRAARSRLRSGRRGEAAQAAGLGADQAQRGRDARHQRRRDRGLRAAHARASVARALHRADAGRRDGDAHRRARRAERRDSRAHRATRSGRSEPTAGPARGNGPAAYYRLAGARGTHRRDHADDAHVLRRAATACASPRTAGCAPVCSAITRWTCARRCAPGVAARAVRPPGARREAAGARAARASRRRTARALAGRGIASSTSAARYVLSMS